jgi:hypothetical protein
MQRSEEGMDGTEYRACQSQTDKRGLAREMMETVLTLKGKE